ncbi:hypothetical protein INT45_005340 [Circinella minor]|uniref:Uncharacterized protein n=1 Tax=Circinella minor TaxID=1195481 RepID=A0A8H7S8Z8_9FUNG|nr:hypothetical protein INT45_005340 [Circinella minor]
MESTTGNNRLTQQRVHIIPSKNMAFFDDDDVDDDGTSSTGYSFTSSVYASATANDTFALAEFLSTTSPDEFAKPSSKKKLQQQYRASRLLSKLRKRGAITNTTNVTTTDSNSIKSNTTNDIVSKGPTSTTARKHIPLPEYHPPPQPEIPTLYQQQQQTKKQSYRLTTMSSTSSSSTNTTPSLSSNHHHHHHHQQYAPSLRDSGVYSEISDKDYIPPPPPVPPPPVPTLDLFPMPPPSIPAKSTARPRRPAPLPANVASAAIHAALRNVPEAALRRQSVIRQQHYQQQQQQQSSGSEKAQQQEKEQELRTGACPHCRQHISSNSFNGKEKDNRRLSCPPALATGELLIKNTNESNLRQMILQLEKQLADERLSRKKLEQAISRQHHQAVINKQEEVAEERDRWKGESLWMENRIASLPE